MSEYQYYVKVYPDTKPSNDMHNGGYERRTREACTEIARQIKRHIDGIEERGVRIEREPLDD